MVDIKNPLDLARFIEAGTSKLHVHVEANIDPNNTLSSIIVEDDCNRLCGLGGRCLTLFTLTFDDDGHVDGVMHTRLNEDVTGKKRIYRTTEWACASRPDEFDDFSLTIWMRAALGLPLDD